MKKDQKSFAIFFFEGSNLVVSSHKQPQGMNFPFPTGAVEHMEIINYDVMRDMITQACATLELKDVPALIVFGKSLLFEKQLPPLAEDKLQTQIELFRDSTPFERVASRVYKNTQGSLLISMNRDFYDTLRQILERATVHVAGIVPPFILTGMVGTGAISMKSLNLLSTKIDELAAESIIVHKVVHKTLQEQQEYISKKYSGAVVVVFVLFLLGVFAATGYILRSQFQASRKPLATPTPVQTQVEVPSEILPAATPEVIASASALKITIFHVPEAASLSAQIRLGLREDNFTQVTLQSQAGLQGNKPLLVFKTGLSPTYKSQIQKRVEDVFPTVGVQELSELAADVTLTIGK